ncbi:hypothetical protein CHU92_00460, partial [Flavobacterium cyanobacteriorum]
ICPGQPFGTVRQQSDLQNAITSQIAWGVICKAKHTTQSIISVEFSRIIRKNTTNIALNQEFAIYLREFFTFKK